MIWKISFCLKQGIEGQRSQRCCCWVLSVAELLRKSHATCDLPLNHLVPPNGEESLLQCKDEDWFDAIRLLYNMRCSYLPSLGILESRLFFCQTSWYVAQTVHVCVIRDLQHAIQEWQGCTVSGTGTTHGRCYRMFKTWCIL